MGHANAPLTPEGRRRLVERIDDVRPIAHVAAEAGVSRSATVRPSAERDKNLSRDNN